MQLRFAASALFLASLCGGFARGEEPAKRIMTVDDLWSIKRVGAPSIAPDGKRCVVDVTIVDVAKDDSSSQLWLLSTDGKQQKQLTNTNGKSSGPKWSPDGKWIAFTSKRGSDETAQVYIIAPEGGEARRVSNMPMAPAHLKWSGDSKTIYCIAWTWPDAPDDDAYRKKEKEQKDLKSKAMIIDDAAFRYWDHWIADGKRPHVFAIDLETGKHRNLLAGTGKFLPPYEPSANDYDASRLGFLAFVSENVKEIGKDSNDDVFEIDLGNPRVSLRNVTADNPASDGHPVYSPDGRSLGFLSQSIKFFYADQQRFRATYLGLDPAVEFKAIPDRSISRAVWLSCGSRVDKRFMTAIPMGAMLFEAEVNGTHQIQVWDEGKKLAGTQKHSDRAASVAILGPDSENFETKSPVEVAFLRSDFDHPPAAFSFTYDFKAPIEPKKIDRFNDSLVSQWKLGKVESVTFKGADDEDVQMWVVYPPDFDATKKWPLVQMVHGGPHSGIDTDFSFRWNPQLWAAQGWVVGIVNFHGSSGFGQKFCDSITGDFATKPTIDIMKATDWFEKQPWIDKDRMAAAGGSYGGYMMCWLNGHTDRFKAMVCHAGVYSYHNQMASDVVVGRGGALGAYSWTDLEKIDKQSAQRFSKNFKTPTLILHGERDFRVPVTHGLEYYNTLKQKGIDARLVYFPDENHWILKPQNSLVWHRETFAWIKKYIGSGPMKE